ERRLAREQRKLSKMYRKGQLQSNRYYRQKIKVNKLHEKIANQRKDFLHKLSRHLVDTYDFICIEDVDMKSMSQCLNFGKSVHDNGWGMFTSMLAYKCEEEGKHLQKIDKWYPSSQTCHVCGTVHDITKDLSVREWTCPDCHTHHNRDVNAAINILNAGMQMMA
ncbi:RNA-guided endonuclease TnpB family protein, partial [Massilimicrobiota timonensis]|uniref:RNA-guided endonuclease TnpB family protein n=1 Tax=Massilimicrobiota timonensis TaxID=1776392 RepID=UPI00101DB7D7